MRTATTRVSRAPPNGRVSVFSGEFTVQKSGVQLSVGTTQRHLNAVRKGGLPPLKFDFNQCWI
jgi:hypothetical protein